MFIPFSMSKFRSYTTVFGLNCLLTQILNVKDKTVTKLFCSKNFQAGAMFEKKPSLCN